MIIPLSRKKLEELIPLFATGAQYGYCWGKFPDFLRRILVSIAALASILLIRSLFPLEEFRGFSFFLGLFALVYWLWGPVFQASLRNFRLRRLKYAGFFRGKVLDVFVTEEVIGTQESANDRGELVVTENRERRINLEVGDESGFKTLLQVPIKQEHRAILPGDIAEMVVLSSRPDLGRISRVTDIFVPRPGIWVSDYPYLRRDEFEAVSRQLEGSYGEDELEENYEPRRRREIYREEEEYDDYEQPRSPAAEYEDDFFEEDYEERPRKRIPKTGANGADRQFKRDRRRQSRSDY
jgi:hypothetical protein